MHHGKVQASMVSDGKIRRVVITGGNGSLGQRLASELSPDCHVLLFDDYEGFHKGVRRRPELGKASNGLVDHVQADLAVWDTAWVSKIDGADTVIHLAAVNPYPEATWEDSRLSMRMSMNVLQAAQRAGVRRFVLASSSHVMGGYLQQGAELSDKAGPIGAATPMSRFTNFRLPGLDTDASGYACAKLAMEEACRAATAAGNLTAVCIRIGWSQPGENVPSQMSATATPTISDSVISNTKQASPEEEVAQGFDDRRLILSWLHRLWLSNRDLRQIFRKAVEAELPSKSHIIVNGMSRNEGMRWSTEGWDVIGYTPEDDAIEWLMKHGGAMPKGSDADVKRRKLES